MADLIERFHQKYVIDENGCWLWSAAIKPNGYGKFAVGYRTCYAHRFAYEHFVGPIPEGLQIDHLCRVRRCVNPAHLEAVSCRENLMRGETVVATRAAKTHCVHGHRFSTANTYVKPNGTRDCKTCRRERKRKVAA